MSRTMLTDSMEQLDQAQLERLCSAIRGKLQFMDYLVRAAAADLERFAGENDPGTRIFLRQLVEMHASNLNLESENMRLVGELARLIETTLGDDTPELSLPPARGGRSS
jgi:hypothetical protein